MKQILSRKLLIGVVATLVAVGGVATALYVNRSDDKSGPTTTATTSPGDEVSGPTEEDKKMAEQNKDEVVQQQAVENSQPSTTIKQANPVITNANQNGQEIFLGGYVSGIYEDNGMCTFNFSKGSERLTKTSSAFANASTTDCKSLTVGRAEFSSSGTWSLTLSYSSPTAAGTSSVKQVVIK